MLRKLTPVICLASLIALSTQAQGPRARGKKLLEFGWDEPDTAFLLRDAPLVVRSGQAATGARGVRFRPS